MAHPAICQSSPHPFRDCLSCCAWGKSIFRDSEAGLIRELDEISQPTIYPAGAVLFLEGDMASSVLCVRSGRIKLGADSEDGRTVILGIVGQGGLLGAREILLGRPHDTSAQAIEPTCLCTIRKLDFLGFVGRNPQVSLRLAERFGKELYDANQQVRGATLKASQERLAELLVELCRTHGRATPEGIHLTINLSQEELAALVGVSRRSLCRALAELRALGIVESRRRGLLVRDSNALQGRLPGLRGFVPSGAQGVRHLA